MDRLVCRLESRRQLGTIIDDVYRRLGFVPFTTSQHMDGVLGGGQIGYNWQFNRSWVIGVEADIQGTGQRGTREFTRRFVIPPIIGALPVIPGFTSAGSLTQKLPWFGTVRARLGAEPSSNWLLYVTGGLAYGQIRSTLNTNALTTTGIATATSASVNNDRAGWTVGVGSEWMFATPVERQGRISLHGLRPHSRMASSAPVPSPR